MCFRTAPRPVDHEIMNKELTALAVLWQLRILVGSYSRQLKSAVLRAPDARMSDGLTIAV